MIRLIACLALISVTTVFGRDIRTRAGTVYREVEILKIDRTEIRIMHAEGVASIDLKDLPPDLQKEFGYTPESYAEGVVVRAQEERSARERATEEAARTALRLAEIQERNRQAELNARAANDARYKAAAERTIANRNYSSESRYTSSNYSAASYSTDRYSVSGYCGAPTKKGGSCRRRVSGGGRCYQH